jgi:hypothetical protein
MARLEKEADLWGAPMFIGEWGFPTYESSDASLEEQLEFILLYHETAAIFEKSGVGTIKAWFAGTRRWQDFLPRGRSTWAIFTDPQDIGTVERKYIIDAIARPYPQEIAGDIHAFAFDPATRRLTVELMPDNSRGASRIFIGANRHYPDGFSVICGEEIILCHDPMRSTGLDVFRAPSDLDPTNFIWNESTQQLTITAWPESSTRLTLQIVPGINNDR